MSLELPIPPPGFEWLSTQEQLAYVEELLDYIASRSQHVQIPTWHRQIIAERMTRFRAVGFQGRTWEEFEQELTKS